jgi:hypothetical protein
MVTIKKNIRVGTVVLTLVLFAGVAFAQSVAVAEQFRDIAGTPFFPRAYVDVNGTPFMFDDFQQSTITLSGGLVLKDIKTNFNLVTGDLLYVDEKGQTMIANPSTIKIIETGLRKFVPSPAKNTYCEVISTQGKAILLRLYKKVIMETKAFNSATAQKNFQTRESHILVAGQTITEVNSASDLYDVLAPSGELKDFAKKEKLRQKSENSWVKIVNYYNSI